jgi:polyhydroxyalkanoate synthesis regulator phasin
MDTVKRLNSSDSRNSDSTTLNNSKLVREMSFGKASLSKYINEEDTLMIYLQNMNDRIIGMEEKIANYTSKTDLLLEKVDARADRKNDEGVAGVCKILGDIQERLDRFEKEKSSQNDVIEGYIQKLEMLRSSKDPLEQSRKSLRHTRPQKAENSSFEAQEMMSYEGTGRSSKSSNTKDRISRLEQRVGRIEQNSLELGKVKQDLEVTIVRNN